MKKIVFVLVALVVATPAFGVAVDVNAVQVGSTANVDITYSASGGKLPRAFALNITVDNDANIVGISNYFRGESSSGSKGYGIFPASFDRHINPADPNWQDVNYTPVAEPNDLPGDTLGGLDTNGITIEMGSLYAGPNEGPNSPATSGTLCRITVSGGCTVTLSANVGRGKVVFEDSTEASPINLSGCTVVITTTVPNVLDMNETAATAAIIAADLVVGDPVIYECNDAELADEVLDQDPNGGATVNTGTDVDLWVSLGSPVVPDVLGDANQAAQDAIDAVVGLSVGDINTACSDSIADGNVISTDPVAGATTCGTTVDIVISTGSPVVPDVVGDANQAAQDAINDVCGLSVGDITTECNDTIADGNVISTYPAAGATTCGTDVNLVISTGACGPFVISGTIATGAAPIKNLAGVTILGLPGTPVTDANGEYSDTVSSGWSGTAEPNKVQWTFASPNTVYSNVTSDQTGEDYTANATECLANTDPGYTYWSTTAGKPDCWCYRRQCRGDATGTAQGPYWVASFDLTLMKTAYDKFEGQIPAGGRCADFNHTPQGPYRVASFDLTILKLYYDKFVGQVPECPTTNINEWKN